MKQIAPIFGIGAMISLFLIYQQKERKNLLLCKMSADICWTLHYLCLTAYGGAIPNFVGIFRETVFLNKNKHKWAEASIWPIVFIVINWILGFRTFTSSINILPIAASTCVSIALWLNNPKLTKLISIPVSATFFTYDYFVGSWIGMINESISIISILIFFIKNGGKKNV